jgi:hypothetical protein
MRENFQSSLGPDCNDNRPWLVEKPMPRYNITKGSRTIFVSVASYRDAECSKTLHSIYSNAEFPANVYVGLCEQNKKGVLEELCVQDDFVRGLVRESSQSPTGSFLDNDPEAVSHQEMDPVKLYRNNIKTYKMDYMEAKGPTYARYFCSTLWSGQEYYLQIDSHTDFVKNWDTLLINMLEQCRYNSGEPTDTKWNSKGSRKPILSAYPAGDNQMALDGFPRMTSCAIGKNGLPIFYADFHRPTEKVLKPPKSPMPYVAAGLMFLDASFLYDVPYDPYLSGLFQGEETLFSARLYTYGYDVFSPYIKVCSHHYNRPGPTYNKDMPDFARCRNYAEIKVHFMLGLRGPEELPKDFLRSYHRYGFGSVRSLKDFWDAAKISVGTGGSLTCTATS